MQSSKILNLHDSTAIEQFHAEWHHSSIVACSGHFAPMHTGHLDHLLAARNLARGLCNNCLVVIVNSDWQMAMKGSAPFMAETDRLRLVAALECVDVACLAVDTDRSVRQSLQLLRPHIFANGGDVRPENTCETAICEELGIEMVWGVGPEKTLSSSQLLLESARWLIKNQRV